MKTKYETMAMRAMVIGTYQDETIFRGLTDDTYALLPLLLLLVVELDDPV
jgi:hypothetical protein